MANERIITNTGKINEYLHHIDLKEFGQNRILSCFIGEFDDFSIILDCGTSLETNRLIRYIKKFIRLSSIKYITTTHHHFDHNGGLWKLYKILKPYNPDVKILTNEITKDLLNNFKNHLSRAMRTYGNFVGEMEPIENDAFKIIEPIIDFEDGIKPKDIIQKFHNNGSEIDLAILKTPGHTPDHQCPVFIKDGKLDFVFFGEAVGTIYHSTKLITTPTSMPVYFNYNDYMSSLEKLKSLSPEKAGFGHFGAINGKESIEYIIKEHKNFMKEFRNEIIKLYKEKPETKYIVDKITPLYLERTDLISEKHPYLKKIILGLVYGMLIDLGYRHD